MTVRERRSLPNSVRNKASRGWAPISPGHAHAGKRFADAAGPAFKADGHALPFLSTRRAQIWDFTPSSSSSALAPCSPCSFASVALPPLASPARLRHHRCHVELDTIQRVSRPTAPPCRGRTAPSTHRRRGVEGARGGVRVAPTQGVRDLVRGLP
jgi:hypothetical protein